MSDDKAAETKGEVVAPPDAELAGSASAGDALGTYLTRSKGRSCVLPFQMVCELTGGSRPGAAASAEWWTDAEGWPASPAAAACASAGWRVASVTHQARLVRFVHVERDARAAREEERERRPRAGSRSAD